MMLSKLDDALSLRMERKMLLRHLAEINCTEPHARGYAMPGFHVGWSKADQVFLHTSEFPEAVAAIRSALEHKLQEVELELLKLGVGIDPPAKPEVGTGALSFTMTGHAP